MSETLSFLKKHGFGQKPLATALVLGTGMGALSDAVQGAVTIPYADIPGFPAIFVSGHKGTLVEGTLENQRLLIFNGRFHAYEQGDAAAMRLPIKVMAELGIERVLLTNAAGSLRPEWPPGSLVVITDHINLSGMNPLFKEVSDQRFVPMNNAYDRELQNLLRDAARKAKLSLGEGIYAWFSGPSFETPAEIRMAKVLGADLVGMSTVPEVILARFYGLKVAALSVVTNAAAGMDNSSPSHSDTKKATADAAPHLITLIRHFLKELPYAG
jgi:purine-nucleoside phosphorylase